MDFLEKFFAENVLLFSILDSNEDGECGIVFTEDKIYNSWDSKLEEIIAYEEIADADFDEDSVTVTMTSGDSKELYCGVSGWDYGKYMYHLIMDIHDRLKS